jgi:hypothetical protein
MELRAGILALCAALAALAAPSAPALSAEAPGEQQATAGPKAPKKIFLAVFDFVSTPPAAGRQLADTIRVRLRRHEEFDVIDPLTTREAAESVPITTDPKAVSAMMADKLAVQVALYGSVEPRGAGMSAKLRCIDLTDPKKPGGWVKEFSDDSERARAVLSKEIVELLRKEGEWAPPEEGTEAEPKANEWGTPVNVNGKFEDPAPAKGWEPADNAATFLVPGPAGRGKILKITTDLVRAPYIEYLRKIRFGLADPTKPPKIGKDTSYASLAGMEGVFHRSEWIDSTPGQRYWLLADMKGKTEGIFFPKIYVKGFMDNTDLAAELPEHSLAERKMTAEQFAAPPADKRKALLAEDIAKHPDRYRRECFRWYLACRDEENIWKHFASPFPPRGGMPKNVRWLRIEVYAYWPPGDFLFDDVLMYKDPRQKAPLPEEKPRSEFFKEGGRQPQPK